MFKSSFSIGLFVLRKDYRADLLDDGGILLRLRLSSTMQALLKINRGASSPTLMLRLEYNGRMPVEYVVLADDGSILATSTNS